jgi:hypothetical protein
MNRSTPADSSGVVDSEGHIVIYMNAENFAEASRWLKNALPVADVCGLVAVYFLTPIPVVEQLMIKPCRCESLEPVLCWHECPHVQEPADAGAWIESMRNWNESDWTKVHEVSIDKISKGRCAYLEFNQTGYLCADKSLWEFRGHILEGASTIWVTLPSIPRPWNNDQRNSNSHILHWPFLVYWTHYRDGPLFTAHILDLRSDLRHFAELRVWPRDDRADQGACFLQDSCLFVGIHGEKCGDGMPNRVSVFSLDDLPCAPVGTYSPIGHHSLFATPGLVFSRSCRLPFQKGDILMSAPLRPRPEAY